MERSKAEVFKSEDAFLINNAHPYAFRPGQSAKIIGAKWVIPEVGMAPRLAWEVQYDDDFIDYVAVSDSKNYRIVGGKFREYEAYRPDSGE